jgi:hypothetical protein
MKHATLTIVLFQQARKNEEKKKITSPQMCVRAPPQLFFIYLYVT